MPLYLRERDVEELLDAAAAVEAAEACFERLARGAVEGRARTSVGFEDVSLAVMAASDGELGVAGSRTSVRGPAGIEAVVALFAGDSSELVALVEAAALAHLRAGATSAVAARRLARADARTLGIVGCGPHAEAQLACLRAALPALAEAVAYCRDEERLAAFCDRVGAEPGEYNRDAAEQDVVVAATASRDPVLRGEWLRPGALVCAAGATRIEARELDNAVVERATFVCCDSLEQARLEAGDLAEPVERGVLDWLEVHELAEVVAGEVVGRHAADDIVLAKTVGIAAVDVALASAAVDRARRAGVGSTL